MPSTILLASMPTPAPPGLGEVLPSWSVLPFLGMLLSIALFPLLAPHFWRRHFPKVALAWAAILAIPLLAAHGAVARHALLEVALRDYVPFITLLWALFTVSGGIVLRGAPRATPAVNVAFLAAGTAAASWIGTTGAAMLLIRPLLRANEGRRHRAHLIVFFIFLVGNVGGSLTPLGDPPLFLGFLHGVPFFWTLHLVPHFLLVAGALLALFYAIDRRHARSDEVRPSTAGRLRLAGRRNLLFAAAIVATVLGSGLWDAGATRVLGITVEWRGLAREALLVVIAVGSIATTPRRLREENGFSWEPIREVAVLFAAIFVTIVPALAILEAGEKGALAPVLRAVREPWQYFWASGLLSSVLDNAPTYLTFLNVALGRLFTGLPHAEAVARLVAGRPDILAAVSAGSVFMGACTYIGNAPNFMIKSIAEEAGVAMPSFFGYVARWTVPVLFPAFLLLTWLCF